MNKRKIINISIITIFLCVTVLLFAPLEMFITNQQEFWFTFSDIIGIILGVTIGVFAIVFLLGLFLKGRLLNNYIAFIFAGSLMFYLQGNFMNLKVGVMNGAEISWSDYRMNFILNLIIWIIGIGIIIYYANKKWTLMEKIIKYIASILTLMQLVTVIILTISTPKYYHDTKKIVSDIDIFNVSEEKNVIVFLLDMFDDTYLKEILLQEPELAAEFTGFTYFSNSVGSHNTTKYSISKLLTGKYLRNEEPFKIQANNAFKDAPMVSTLDKNGYSIDIYMDLKDTMPEDLYACMDNNIEGKNMICSEVGFIKRMYTLVACKYFPNIVKPFIWMDGTEFEILKDLKLDNAETWSSNNLVFYDKLKNSEFTINKPGKSFKFVYLYGAHYPYYHDKYLNEIPKNYTNHVDAARGSLRIVQEYIKKLQEINIYDNTAIVIIGDHGYYQDGVLTNPVLLVKPMNEEGELKISHAPVCHDDFQASILYLAGLNDNMEYGKSYFDIEEGEERERLFYQYNLREDEIEGNYRLIEYIVDSSDNKRENFQLTDVEYSVTGEKSTHKDKCKFCLSGEEIPVETKENWPVMTVH